MLICDISLLNKNGKHLLDRMLGDLAMDWRELVVMLVIDRDPGIPQRRLVPYLQTDKANVTKALQTMENKGLIRRDPDPQDQRNKVCSLTGQGARLIPELTGILSAWEAACLRGLNMEDLNAFHRISKVIISNLDM